MEEGGHMCQGQSGIGPLSLRRQSEVNGEQRYKY